MSKRKSSNGKPAKDLGALPTPQMGRPFVYPSELMIEALKASNGLVRFAAQRIGCEPVTIRDRARRDPRVAEAIAQPKLDLVDIAQGGLLAALTKKERVQDGVDANGLPTFKEILAPEPWAIQFTLKTIGGWSEKHEHKIGGTVQHALVDISRLTREEQDAILKADVIMRQLEEGTYEEDGPVDSGPEGEGEPPGHGDAV